MTLVLSVILMILQIVLALFNLGILIYGFKKFVSSPRVNLETRVKALELEVDNIKESLLKGNDKFRSQDETLEVLLRSTLALIEFEIQYCLLEKKQPTKELEEAKTSLHGYLSKR